MQSHSKRIPVKSKVALLGLGILFAGTVDSAFADVYVICNAGLELSKEDIADVFLGEKQVAGGKKLTPMDNGPIEVTFLQKVLRTTKVKYEMQWAKVAFREGLNAPQVKSGDADVIAGVKESPGGVGYISQVPGPDVKVLGKF
jgi:hypothetical protein